MSLCTPDLDLLISLGFNVVRLGTMWPALQPSPRGPVSRTHLTLLHDLVRTLHSRGLYTILDLHQDLFSSHFCGEGVPDWVASEISLRHPFPWPLVNPPANLSDCLKRKFSEFYASEAVGVAFQALYDDVGGIAGELARTWREVAREFREEEGVLGYEIINEPWVGDAWKHERLLEPGVADVKNLMPLYERVYRAIREVDNETVVFFEKSLINAVGGIGFKSGPGGRGDPNQALSYHNYCGTVDRNGDPRSVLLCKGEQSVQWEQEMADLKAVNCAGFMTEFGAVSEASKGTDGLRWLADLADSRLQSWSYWQYKSFGDFTTASNDLESLFYPNGTLQSDKVSALSRAYATSVAGVPTKMSYSASKRSFVLDYRTSASVSNPHTEIFLPSSVMGRPSVTVTPSNSATWSITGDRLGLTNSRDAPPGTLIHVEVKNSL